MPESCLRRLPVILPPYADELLSSWIGRHATFYAVPPLVMLRHCLPEASSLRSADLNLNGDQAVCLARIFSTDAAFLNRMTFTNIMPSSRRFVAAITIQFCPTCSSSHNKPRPVLRSQLLGWRITCPFCGDLLQDVRGPDLASQFRAYRSAALQGEKLLDDEIERGIRTWTSPVDIARLLLMRRVPRPLPRKEGLSCFRVLGAIIPDLDHIVAVEQLNLPTPASPILPLHFRPALLAGVAIVERAGPEMLHMLRRHMLGDNSTRFSELAETMMGEINNRGASSQMQLI